MSVSPSVPHNILWDPCNNFQTLQWTSYEPVILWLQWTQEQPTVIPVTRRFRGREYPCGYSVTMPHVNCTRQVEPGPSITHTFELPTLVPGTPMWYRVATDCNPKNPVSSTPPLRRDVPDCPTTTGFIKVRRATNSVSSSSVSLALPDIVGGNPSFYNAPNQCPQTAGTGHYLGYAIFTFRQNLSIPNTGTTWRFSYSGGIPLTAYTPVDATLRDNDEVDVVLNLDWANAGAGSTIVRVEANKLSGPDAVGQFRGSTHPALQVLIKQSP